MSMNNSVSPRKKWNKNRAFDRAFTILTWTIGVFSVLFVLTLLFLILEKGLPKLTWSFLYNVPSEVDVGGGIGPALFNSFYVLFLSLAIFIPLGMAAGIYLAEFAPKNRWIAVIRICVEGLASVRSLIFGLFGIVIFVELSISDSQF